MKRSSSRHWVSTEAHWHHFSLTSDTGAPLLSLTQGHCSCHWKRGIILLTSTGASFLPMTQNWHSGSYHSQWCRGIFYSYWPLIQENIYWPLTKGYFFTSNYTMVFIPTEHWCLSIATTDIRDLLTPSDYWHIGTFYFHWPPTRGIFTPTK